MTSPDNDENAAAVLALETEKALTCIIAADIRLFSGCEDAQTSADVSSIEGFQLPDPAGLGGGACTSGLLQVLYADHKDRAQDLSFEQVLFDLRENLAGRGLSQIPQLSSSRPMDMKQPFHIVPEGSTGTRRAVMIGINYTGQEGELSGCQNDCKNVSKNKTVGYLSFRFLFIENSSICICTCCCS